MNKKKTETTKAQYKGFWFDIQTDSNNKQFIYIDNCLLTRKFLPSEIGQRVYLPIST